MISELRQAMFPDLFVSETLGHVPWSKQIEILNSIRDNRVTTVKSCHSAGKTRVAADAVLWYLYNHKDSLVITSAPTARQVEGILWSEIRSAHSSAKRALPGTVLQLEIKLSDRWRALGFTTNEPDKFQGWHALHTLVVLDESSGIDDEIFSAVDGILTSDESRLLLIGNPTNPNGRFFKSFTSSANKITISAYDTPNLSTFGIKETHIADGSWEQMVTGPLPHPYLVTPRWVAERYQQWGPESSIFQAKVRAEFPLSGTDTLIPLHWIEAAIERDLGHGEPVQLGCDIARFGSDETVIMCREGARARIKTVLPMSDTMETTGRIIQDMRETGADVCKIDSVGVGAGVYDRLVEQGINAVEMSSGTSAYDKERFANSRAEWWWALRSRFETGDIDIADDEGLIAQLAGVKYKFNSAGKILIESKEEMKRRGVPSPDRADALMLVFGLSLDERNIPGDPGPLISFGGICDEYGERIPMPDDDPYPSGEWKLSDYARHARGL